MEECLKFWSVENVFRSKFGPLFVFTGLRQRVILFIHLVKTFLSSLVPKGSKPIVGECTALQLESDEGI